MRKTKKIQLGDSSQPAIQLPKTTFNMLTKTTLTFTLLSTLAVAETPKVVEFSNEYCYSLTGAFTGTYNPMCQLPTWEHKQRATVNSWYEKETNTFFFKSKTLSCDAEPKPNEDGKFCSIRIKRGKKVKVCKDEAPGGCNINHLEDEKQKDPFDLLSMTIADLNEAIGSGVATAGQLGRMS